MRLVVGVIRHTLRHVLARQSSVLYRYSVPLATRAPPVLYRTVCSGRYGDPDTFGDLSRPVEWKEDSEADQKNNTPPKHPSGDVGRHVEHGRRMSDGERIRASQSPHSPITAGEPSPPPSSIPASTSASPSSYQRPSVLDWDLEEDDADDIEKEQLAKLISGIPRTELNAHGFGRKMKKLIRRGQLRDALDLFENQMLQVDRVQPDRYCYNVLIAGCGRAGDTYKAFRLYNDMKKRRLRANHVTYTSLLNSCANGHHPHDSLKKIQRLREIMLEKGYQMNVINYQALIKAYGRCGELQLAFAAADELLQLGQPLTAELASFLVQGCIGDRREGFRHALLVWHQMRQKQVQPDVFSYNLLVRAALECGAGDTAIFEQAMEVIVSRSPSSGASLSDNMPVRQKLQAGEDINGPISQSEAGDPRALISEGTSVAETPSSAAETRLAASLLKAEVTSPDGCRLPNLVSLAPTRGELVELKHLDTAEARVGLLGGWDGILRTMASDGVVPDIKTFSLLLKTLPHKLDQEESLMKVMDAVGVLPDVGFYNQLIKKRCAGPNHSTVQSVLSSMESRGVKPDIATYGCVAMSVRSAKEGEAFLTSLETAGIRPNVEILTTLLRAASHSLRPRLARVALEAFVQHQVPADRRALRLTEELRLKLRQLIMDKERGLEVPSVAQKDTFTVAAQNFLRRYSALLSELEVEEETHVTQQYRVTSLKQRAAERAAEEERGEEEEGPIRADWKVAAKGTWIGTGTTLP